MGDPVTYTVTEERIAEWRQELCEAVEKLQSVTRHSGSEGLNLAERVLLELLTDVECLVDNANEEMSAFVKHGPHA